MADNISSEFPETEFVRPCNLCPHMQGITLSSVHAALAKMQFAIEIPSNVAVAARSCVQRMFEITESRPRNVA